MRTTKTLIRLGWSESSLGTQIILLVLSWGSSCKRQSRNGKQCRTWSDCSWSVSVCPDLFVWKPGINMVCLHLWLYGLVCLDLLYEVIELWMFIKLNQSFNILSIFIVIALMQVERWISKWAPSSEFVSSSIPSWHILTAHAQPFRGARDLAFCLKVPLDSLLVLASSEGSGETARMRRLAWTFAARIGYKYQIRLTRSK